MTLIRRVFADKTIYPGAGLQGLFFIFPIGIFGMHQLKPLRIGLESVQTEIRAEVNQSPIVFG